jgi:hypothetical protein
MLNKFLNQDTYKKKVSNILYYNKYYIRSNLLNLKTHVLIDNNNSFLNQDLNKLSSLTTNLGFSLLAKNKQFKNKNSSVKFNFILNQYNPNCLFLEGFKNNLLIFSKKDKFLDGLLLNPIKGGFNCYCNGAIGFLPRVHAISSVNFLLESLNNIPKTRHKNKFINVLNFFFKKNYLNQKNIFRLPVFLGSASLFPLNKKNNFSSVLKKRMKIYPSKLNFVFLFYNEENEI